MSMDRPKLDYNQLAGTYHQRYRQGGMEGIGIALRQLAKERAAKTALEVGCGTGRWVESLRADGLQVFGVDAFTGMLQQASRRLGPAGLVAGTANRLPFAAAGFDLVYCVNALHHFEDPDSFLLQAPALLKPGGTLAIAGIDPRVSPRRYYYEYFPGSLDLDLSRYQSFGHIVDVMARAGLQNLELRIVDKVDIGFRGAEIFSDPFLEKSSNSLLALLSDEAYAEGLQRLTAAVEKNPDVLIRAQLNFSMITGIAC